MKKINILYILFAIALLAGGCATEKFYLYKGLSYQIEGEILGAIDSVEQTHDNAFVLRPGGIVSLRMSGVTEFFSEFDLRLQQGSGIRFALRTGKYKYSERPSITCDFTSDGTEVKQNGKFLAMRNEIKAVPGELQKVRIHNYNHVCNIVIECDTIWSGRTDLLDSEYIIIESIGKTYAQITGMEFHEIDEGEISPMR